MVFTQVSSTDPADLTFLLNRLGDELSTDISSAGGTATWAGVTGKPTTYPPAPHTHAWTAIEGKPATYPPAAHSHAVGDVTGLDARLAALEVGGGPRMTTELLNGWTGTVRVSRVGPLVALTLDGINGDAATDGVPIELPSGYFPDGRMGPARGLLHGAVGAGVDILYRYFISSFGLTIYGAHNAAVGGIYGTVVYRTADPEPAVPIWSPA